MIQSMSVAGVATFGDTPEELKDLRSINFIFGTNGCGKTTISRLVADEDSFRDCKVVWRGGSKLQSLVYNRDFIQRNFDQSSELKGVFTLGQSNVEVENEIKSARLEVASLTKKIDRLKQNLDGSEGFAGKRAEC